MRFHGMNFHNASTREQQIYAYAMIIENFGAFPATAASLPNLPHEFLGKFEHVTVLD
jgi:hypothetical protein